MAALIHGGLAVAAAAVLYRGYALGRFSHGAFAGSPGRGGTLELIDVVITLGLWVFVSALGFTVAVQVMGEGWFDGPAGLMRRMLVGQALALPVVAYVLFRARESVEGGLDGLGVSVRRMGGLVYAAGLLLAVLPILMTVSMLTYVVVSALGYSPTVLAHEALRAMTETQSVGVRAGFAVSAVVAAPVVEELMFRGMVQTAFVQSAGLKALWARVGGRFERWHAIVLTSVLFTMIHLGAAEPHALVTLYVFSLALGYAYERTGSLWVPIGMHALFNAMQVALVLGGVASEPTGGS